MPRAPPIVHQAGRWCQSQEEWFPTPRTVDGRVWCGFTMKEIVCYMDDEGNTQAARYILLVQQQIAFGFTLRWRQ